MDRATTQSLYHATFTGKGEFYSGIGNGDEVIVTERVTAYDFGGQRKATVSLSAQRVGGGAHLTVSPSELADIHPVEEGR